MPTYTYDPTLITQDGIDRMRFELADTEVDGGKQTCALCDEEYNAIITQVLQDQRKGWTRAKLKCLNAIMMRFSVEVDFSAGGGNVSLAQRYERWKALHDTLEKSMAFPTANIGAISGDNYFHYDMQSNPEGKTSPLFGIPERAVGVGSDG